MSPRTLGGAKLGMVNVLLLKVQVLAVVSKLSSIWLGLIES